LSRRATPAAPAAPFRPSPASLAVLSGLGVLAALLSLFLWAELLLARAGGSALCALADTTACAQLWDGPFASAVHRITGLPVAAWGLVWALPAATLPILALVRAAEGREGIQWLAAARITAAAGVVGAFVLIAVALQVRTFCVGCFLAYLLVFGYAGIALVGWRALGLPQASRALGLSSTAAVTAFALLLYPGLRTPRSGDAAGLRAVSAAPGSSTPAGAGLAGAGPADDLTRFVGSLEPRMRQTLADALHLYRNGASFPPGPARALHGPAGAPVRITDFTDIRCRHCAELYQALAVLEREAPKGAFSVEPRQFPLDNACNPYVQRGGDPVRCLAAKARICAEGRTGAQDFGARLFAKQDSLTEGDVYDLLEGLMSRRELEACVARPETAAKLRDDVDLAARYRPDGTPLVLVNGRQAVSFPPFLFAMILNGGRSDHPAFASLPPANPNAHLH
jgi:serine/threonine-protein kinase